MIKKLLDKAKKNVYEIHCVKVDDLHSSQSVVGSLSGGGKRRVSGSTHTLHQSVVNANNRLYQNVQKNGSYPFKVSDRMAFVCYEQKNGIWKIESLINFTNHSNAILKKFFAYLFLCPLSWFLGLMCAFLAGFVVSIPMQISKGAGGGIADWISLGLVLCVVLAYIIFFFWLPYYLYNDYQHYKLAVRVLEALKNKKTEEEIKSCLASYKGKSLISENFFSAEPKVE